MRPRFMLPVLGVLPVRSKPRAQDRRLNQDATGIPQGETMITVDPNNPQHLVATWMEWNTPRGQIETTASARSLDGGATWAWVTVFGGGPPTDPNGDQTVGIPAVPG